MSQHRITFLITDLEPGGAERQLVELVTRLPKGEFEPHVVVLQPPPSFPELARRLAEADVATEFLNLTSKWRWRAAFRNLVDRLRELRPHLLQCFLHHANIAGAVAATRVDVLPVVTGIRVAEHRWNTHRLLARLTDHYVHRHVCVSQSVARFAVRRMKLPTSKLVVIPNGVDVDRFVDTEDVDVARLGLPPHGRMLIYVGRLDRQKRIDWLLRRMPEVTRRLPEHHLMLAGGGPEENRLRRLSEKLQIADRVHFIGWRTDVPGILAAADVLMLTSAWEGMPNVVLESMAAGKPVIATAAEGIDEVLGPLASVTTKQSEAGGVIRQLVPADNADAFVDAVVRIASSRSLAARIGRLNRQRVREEFSLEQMVRRYKLLYRELLRTRKQ